MANKTINELTEMTSFVESDELAIYDVSNDLTTKGKIKNLFKTPLTDLNTTSKNLIGAINENKAAIQSGGGSGSGLPTPPDTQGEYMLSLSVSSSDQGQSFIYNYGWEQYINGDDIQYGTTQPS